MCTAGSAETYAHGRDSLRGGYPKDSASSLYQTGYCLSLGSPNVRRWGTSLEPYRNPVTPIQIRSCWGKLIAVEGEMIREFKRQKKSCTEADLPYLWILTPTASQTILNGFATKTIEEFQEGVYVCGKLFRMGIVVIHQLPVTPETLLLRLLGRGKVQTNAISEVESLRDDNPLKSIVLEQLYNLQQNLFV